LRFFVLGAAAQHIAIAAIASGIKKSFRFFLFIQRTLDFQRQSIQMLRQRRKTAGTSADQLRAC